MENAASSPPGEDRPTDAPAAAKPRRPRGLLLGRLRWNDPNTRFVGLAVLVGLLGSAGAIVFRLLTHELTRLATGSPDIVAGAASLPPLRRVLLPALGGLVGGFVARRFVRTGGTMGIAQIMEVVAVGRRTVRFRQSAARTASSLVVISTGGSEGREGPIIQMAAAFASLVARAMRVSPERAQILVACGMAAGVAGAYNTPISATLFVLELVVGSFSMAVFGPVVVSAVVSGLVTRAVIGNAPLYRVAPFEITSPLDFLPYVPLGLLAGIASVFFMRALRLAKRAFHATGWHDEYRMALAGAGVGALGLLYPAVWGNGFEGTNAMLAGTWTVGALAALGLAKIAATGLTIGSGGVGGVFTPALMVGATLGAIVGTVAHGLAPHLTAPISCYALLGMGGLLAGTTRAPLLAIIMMFELTDAPAILLPMMLVAVLAIAGARIFERESIYVEELREHGVEWQDSPQATALGSLRVVDILRRDVVPVPRTLPIETVLDTLLGGRALALYVTADDGRLLGMVDLHDLKEVLRSGDLVGPIIANDVLREAPAVTGEESLSSLNERLWLLDYDELPVVDAERRFLGVVTRRDVLAAFDREILRRGALLARISHLGADPREVDWFEVPEAHRLASLEIPEDLVGRTLAEAGLRQRGLTVLAVNRLEPDGRVRRFVPTPDERLRRGDRLVVLGALDSLPDLGRRGARSG